MDYSGPPKFTVINKRKARILAITIAIGFPAIFFYNVIHSHFFRLNRAFSDIHMVTVNVVAGESLLTYPLFALSAQDNCARLVQKSQSSSAVSYSAASVQSTSAGSSASANVSGNASASSVPEFALPNALKPLETPPTCVAPLKLPEGIDRLGVDGFVTLELTINKDGKVVRTDVLRSSGFADLDQATAEQVTAAWQLDPCVHEGKTIECKRQLRVRWEN